MERKLRLTRAVTRLECQWLDRDFMPGEEVWEYHGHTYGCITPTGIAACDGPGSPTPFFELPEEAVVAVQPEERRS